MCNSFIGDLRNSVHAGLCKHYKELLQCTTGEDDMPGLWLCTKLFLHPATPYLHPAVPYINTDNTVPAPLVWRLVGTAYPPLSEYITTRKCPLNWFHKKFEQLYFARVSVDLQYRQGKQPTHCSSSYSSSSNFWSIEPAYQGQS
jgi:hypothetical protein